MAEAKTMPSGRAESVPGTLSAPAAHGDDDHAGRDGAHQFDRLVRIGAAVERDAGDAAPGIGAAGADDPVAAARDAAVTADADIAVAAGEQHHSGFRLASRFVEQRLAAAEEAAEIDDFLCRRNAGQQRQWQREHKPPHRRDHLLPPLPRLAASLFPIMKNWMPARQPHLGRKLGSQRNFACSAASSRIQLRKAAIAGRCATASGQTT
jgi:hypothetical protein